MPTQPQHRIIECQLTDAALHNVDEDGTREYRFPAAIEASLLWTGLRIHTFHVTNGVEIVESCRVSIQLHTQDGHTMEILPPRYMRGEMRFPSPIQAMTFLEEEDVPHGYRLFVRAPAADAILRITLHGYLNREHPDHSGIVFEAGKRQVARVHEAGLGDSVWVVDYSDDGPTRPDLQA